MKPSVESIVARRRRLSSEYDAKHGIVRKEDVFRPAPQVPSSAISDSSPVPLHGPEYGTAVADPRTQGSSSGFGVDAASPQHLGNGQEDICHTPKFDMKLPSFEDIVARRRRQPDSSDSQPGDIAERDAEEWEAATPALIRALEAAGCCATPRTSGARRRSLDSFAPPLEFDIDEFASDDSTEGNYGQPYARGEGRKEGVEQTNSSSQLERESRTNPTQATPSAEAEHVHEYTKKSEIEERIEGSVSHFLPPRNCPVVRQQKQERCTGSGLGRHMYVVPPPRRRVELSEYFVGEVVIVKRDRHVWVFGQVKMLGWTGIKVWVPSVAIMVNVPLEIMYTHLRKLEDEELQKKSELAIPRGSAEDDEDEQDRIPLPATFHRRKDLVIASRKPPTNSTQVHLVRPAHLAHRTLYQPFKSSVSCTICFQLMSLMDAHKPWGCAHSCHLFCYELFVQSTSSTTCNTCSTGKTWDWKIISCKCGFSGFVRKKVDDLDPPPVCPSCLKLTPRLIPYQAAPTRVSQPESRPSTGATSSSSNPGGLTTTASQASDSSSETWATEAVIKLPRHAINIDDSEWRRVECDCGLQATLRADADPSKPLICPACSVQITKWIIPSRDDLLKSLLGYTPLDSPTSGSSPAYSCSSQPVSPLPLPKIKTPASSDFSLFDGLKRQRESPSKLLAPINTPSSRLSSPSPAGSGQSNDSSPMSDQTSPQGSFTTPVTHLPVPPSSVHDFPSPSPSPCTSSSELQSPAPSQYKQLSTQLGSSGGTKAEQKPSSPAIAPSPRRPPRSPAPTPKSGPSSPPTSPDSSNQFEKSTPQANRPRQLPTDSLSFRLTPGQIRQKMKDQAKKQTTEILMATSNEPEQMPPTSLATSRRDMPADSVSMWVTAAKVKEKLREEELRTQQIQDPPTLKNLAPPSLPEQAPFTALESSSSAASIKRVAWERDNPQQMPEPPSVQIQPPPPAQLLKQGSPTMAKKSSVTDSVPMWLTPEMIKQMAIEEESRQLGEDSNAPAQKMTTIQQGPPQSKPAVQKQPPLPAQRRDMPADSISMWMTPAKVKKMMMEESQKQQNDPPKALRRDLPTDSVSLWMTPAKLKQMALEENSRSQVQETIRPLIIGEELRKPIAKIEEEPEASMIDDEELSIHIPGPSTSTKRALPADSLSLYQVKKIMEAKAQKSIPGFVPSSSASAAVGTVEEAELRKPIAKIEEESEASLIDGEELSVQMPRPSTSTKRALPADSLSLYQVKKIMEAKAKQSISGFVPLSSTPAALGTIEEAELRKPIAKIEEESEASVIDDEELSIQMPGPSMSTKRALPADSLSLYQVKKIMEAKAKQSIPGFVPLSSASAALGTIEEAELRKPIAKIEEESEASVIDDEELSIQMPGPSTSTKRALPADSLSLYQVKKIMEAKAQQSNPGFVPLSSASQALGSVEEADAAEEDVSTSTPQTTKPVQTLKKLPLKLQEIPEEEEVTHRLSPATPSSLSSASSSSSSSSQEQLPEPTSLATRLQKLKAKKSQTSPPHVIPDTLNQPDQPSGVPENGWITIVRDGQAR